MIGQLNKEKFPQQSVTQNPNCNCSLESVLVVYISIVKNVNFAYFMYRFEEFSCSIESSSLACSTSSGSNLVLAINEIS